MRITITLEVPDGSKMTMANDTEYLCHKEHPDYAAGLNLSPLATTNREIEELKASCSHYQKVNSHLEALIVKMESDAKNRMESIKDVLQEQIDKNKPVPVPVKPSRKFHCSNCDKDFFSQTVNSQVMCPECHAPDCDLAAQPKDDFQTIACIECQTIYDKSTGGKFGTCPACTMVRCPTCKQPASLAGMKGDKCATCRGEISNA